MAVGDGRVVSNFVVQALSNRDITIYGNGEQTRSFCYVDDLIEGFIRMMNPGQVNPGPINLGNPIEFTMLELAEKILTMTRSNSNIRFQPLPEDDPRQRKPDISMAQDSLGWLPKVQLDEGLAATTEYFRAVISI